MQFLARNIKEFIVKGRPDLAMSADPAFQPIGTGICALKSHACRKKKTGTGGVDGRAMKRASKCEAFAVGYDRCRPVVIINRDHAMQPLDALLFIQQSMRSMKDHLQGHNSAGIFKFTCSPDNIHIAKICCSSNTSCKPKLIKHLLSVTLTRHFSGLHLILPNVFF